MKTTTTLLAFFISISMVNAQNWGKDKIKGSGNEITVTRTTSDYDEISTGGAFSVELVAGKEGAITMVGDDNLLELIITKVENNKLKIYIEKGTWFDSRGELIKITVPFEDISKVDFGGSGKITTKNPIKTSNLEVNLSGSGNAKIDASTSSLSAILSGSGNLNMKGSTNEISVKLSGSGGIDCSSLTSENATALISGSGNIDLNCSKSLIGKISGSGNIIYSGNPESVEKKISGSGNILKD
jgi:Putative auto-transporter adhesin, head GIN domain